MSEAFDARYSARSRRSTSASAEAHGLEPDAIDHLVEAARELIGAARSVLDAVESVLDEQVEERTRSRQPRARVRRIDID